MARMKDMARMAAAREGGGGGAGAGAGLGLGASPETSPEEMMMPEGAAGEGDLETGLSMVEAAIETLSPEIAQQARTHLEALRQIAADAEAAGSEGPAMPPESGGELAGSRQLPETV